MSERRGWAVGAAVVVAVACVTTQVAIPSVARAATIRLINHDGPNEGFNDPAPAAPVGGNDGLTIGDQRLIAFQRALAIWAGQLDSAVEIRVGAAFDQLDCNASAVTLGMAGPTAVRSDFPGAPLPGTLYPLALADHLAGVDLDPGEDDIDATFNSVFGTSCQFPGGWYYGLDGAPPADDSDLVTVVLHELGHGLGFLSLVNVHNGARHEGMDDVFMSFLIDDRSGKRFTEMSNGERVAAIVATGHLRWDGDEVADGSSRLGSGSDESGRVEMYAPPQAFDGSSVSHWSDELFPNELMEPYFTQSIRDIGLAAEALADMGWAPIIFPGCQGDCDESGAVSINELISAVRVSLGVAPVGSCPAADPDDSGAVAVNELVGAVVRALNGCD
jgi:hypothetical protein